MLGTHAHDFSSIVHFLPFAQNFISKQLCMPCRALNQPRKHRYSRGLPGAIVPQQAENLICVHFDINAVDRFEAIFIDLLQSRDPKKLVFSLL